MANVEEKKAEPIDRCPDCGSTFVDWDPSVRRWRCLVRKCGWIEANESSPGAYNYLTGNSSTRRTVDSLPSR